MNITKEMKDKVTRELNAAHREMLLAEEEYLARTAEYEAMQAVLTCKHKLRRLPSRTEVLHDCEICGFLWVSEE